MLNIYIHLEQKLKRLMYSNRRTADVGAPIDDGDDLMKQRQI